LRSHRTMFNSYWRWKPFALGSVPSSSHCHTVNVFQFYNCIDVGLKWCTSSSHNIILDQLAQLREALLQRWWAACKRRPVLLHQPGCCHGTAVQGSEREREQEELVVPKDLLNKDDSCSIGGAFGWRILHAACEAPGAGGSGGPLLPASPPDHTATPPVQSRAHMTHKRLPDRWKMCIMSTWCSFERSRRGGYYGRCGATTIYLSPNNIFPEKNASESPDDIWSNQIIINSSFMRKSSPHLETVTWRLPSNR